MPYLLHKLPLALGNRVQVAGLEARRLGGARVRVAGTESHGWGALFLPMSEVRLLGLGMTVLRAGVWELRGACYGQARNSEVVRSWDPKAFQV